MNNENTNTRQPIVSVIVPVYNVEAYLKKCIDSLLSQTYSNIEIILVDDGSTDKSGTLCDSAASMNDSVRVIHKKNGGLSDARNIGLKHSKGMFVCFVDSDDYVSPHYVSRLYETILSTGADIAVCGLYRVPEDGPINAETCEGAELAGLEAVRRLLMSNGVCEVVAWNKLYKKQLFIKNNIVYPFGKISEDIFTTYKLLYKSVKVIFINDPLYYYVERKSSIIGSSYSRRKLDAIEGTDQIVAWAEEDCVSLLEIAYAFRVRMTLFLANEISGQAEKDVQALHEFSKWIRKHARLLLMNSHISNARKVTLFVLMIGWMPYLLAKSINGYQSQ